MNTLLATGFVVDASHEGTTFPSAGGNSGSPKVQAVYWRCVVAFFASARITNPAQRLALFTNVEPPKAEGISVSAVLERYQVEVHRVPLSVRLPTGRVASWGNVLYFFDILAALEGEPDDLRFALVDTDVLTTASLAPLWSLLDQSQFVGYVLGTGADEPINGMTRRTMARAASSIAGRELPPLPHFGGELFATTIGAWKSNRALFERILVDALAGRGAAAEVVTEEHIFSIAFALLAQPAIDAKGVIKRLWTSPRYSCVQPGDERLPMWHLPAEKRYGLADLYRHMSRSGFPVHLPAHEFRSLAGRLCGVPHKSIAKFFHDGVRQVAAKFDRRT